LLAITAYMLKVAPVWPGQSFIPNPDDGHSWHENSSTGNGSRTRDPSCAYIPEDARFACGQVIRTFRCGNVCTWSENTRNIICFHCLRLDSDTPRHHHLRFLNSKLRTQ
jgi:hypothetical protein